MTPLELLCFSAVWVAVIYAFNCLLAGRLKEIRLDQMLMYVTSVAVVGVFGEVAVGSIYRALFGAPLWEYHVLPIHHAFTSLYSPVIWGMYGFYLYLLHDHLNKTGQRSTKKLASLIAVEGIALEVLFNISALIFFKQYVFYYLPPDLWHVSSLQAIPFYFLAGVVIVKYTRSFKGDPWFFTIANMLLICVLVCLT